MEKDDIFGLIKEEILSVLPLVNETDIKPEAKLFDLGANSIDRSEIAINCMAKLKVKIDPLTLSKIKNIGELQNALYTAMNVLQ